jgi:hypothetical protein
MNRLAYLCGAGVVFAVGFYTGQQHSEPGPTQTSALAAKPTGLAGHGDLKAHGGHNLLPPPSAASSEPTSEAQRPPHELRQGIVTEQPSPEDIARQDSLNAELIASMQANHLPKEHIEQMAKTLATRKEAMTPKADEPPVQEHSPAELASELKESLKQAGAPQTVIDDMVERRHPSAADADTSQEAPPPRPHETQPPG